MASEMLIPTKRINAPVGETAGWSLDQTSDRLSLIYCRMVICCVLTCLNINTVHYAVHFISSHQGIKGKEQNLSRAPLRWAGHQSVDSVSRPDTLLLCFSLIKKIILTTKFNMCFVRSLFTPVFSVFKWTQSSLQDEMWEDKHQQELVGTTRSYRFTFQITWENTFLKTIPLRLPSPTSCFQFNKVPMKVTVPLRT